jgi:hypothetical protein
MHGELIMLATIEEQSAMVAAEVDASRETHQFDNACLANDQSAEAWDDTRKIRQGYLDFIGSVPKVIADVPVWKVQLGPNGKNPIPENQVEAWLDRP